MQSIVPRRFDILRRVGRFAALCLSQYSKIGAQLRVHHFFERKILGYVAEALRCAMRRQFRIENEFEDRRGQSLSIARLNEQTVLAMPNNFWNIAHFGSN